MKDFNFYSLVSILIAVSWLILKFCYEPSRVRHIQGPMRFPIIGSAWIFVGKSPSQLFSTLKETCEKYEKIFKIYVGGQLDIVLNDPQDVEVLLTDTALMEKAVEYGPIKEWLGDGLLISSGKKWHARRKILTSAFHFNILEEFTEVFTSNSDILIAKLSNFKDNVIDVFPLITLYALDVICETSMGVKINAQLNQDSDYVKAVKEISEIISIRHYNFLMRSDFVFKFTPLYRRQKKVLAKLHGFTENVIKSRRAEYSEIQHHPKSEDEFGRKRKMALLDLLLRSSIEGKMLTDKDIREEVDTFMFEGHDTVTSATCFCLYNLAKNPRVQENVFNEIMNVFGGNFDRKIEIYDLNCLNYLELVIKENLRLYPSVPIFGRKVNESFYLSKELKHVILSLN